MKKEMLIQEALSQTHQSILKTQWMNKKVFLILGIALILVMPLISAGVGIKWSQESLIVTEGEKTCMTYSVYNPWPEESYVLIDLSDELKSVLTSQEAETKLVPANTPSSAAIPVQFCFEIPRVYERDCWFSGYICKQECKEQPKSYSGEVLVKSVPPQTTISGAGGSATQMSVSAPLNLKISCVAYPREFTLVYVSAAAIALIIILILLIKKYRKPKIERDKEKLRKLQAQIKKEKK